LAAPLFKLKTVDERSFARQDPAGRETPPLSLRASALDCTDAAPGTISAQLRCGLLATHVAGLSSHPATYVSGKSTQKRANSRQGSVLNKIPPWCAVHSLRHYTITVRKSMMLALDDRIPGTNPTCNYYNFF